MRRIERLGAELAYAIRERDSRRELYDHADARVRKIEREILEASTNALEADTASQPRVPDERPTEQIQRVGPLLECPGAPHCYLAGQVHAHDDHGIIWQS